MRLHISNLNNTLESLDLAIDAIRKEANELRLGEHDEKRLKALQCASDKWLDEARDHMERYLSELQRQKEG